MANYITVDGGTTNTRVSLICNNKVILTEKIAVGVGSGSKTELKNAINLAVRSILSKISLTESDIDCILASGMITSERGLIDLPHIKLPVGKKALKESAYETVIPEISQIPFVFIRGVKKNGATFLDADIMRGEETELFGMLQNPEGDCLYILPGSHSKHISVDHSGNITDFRTAMTGELFSAVINHTILRYSASLENSEINEARLFEGFECTEKLGINEALFKTRILGTAFGCGGSECYSFLLGCVLCDEVKSIISAAERSVIIGGQKHFRKALAVLLGNYCNKQITVLSDSEVEYSTALGAVGIYEFNRKCNQSCLKHIN